MGTGVTSKWSHYIPPSNLCMEFLETNIRKMESYEELFLKEQLS